MNILFITTNWRSSGGDWTFTNEFFKIFQKNGHKVIPFAMKHPDNFKSEYENYFLDEINYNDLNKSKSFSNGLKVLKSSIYSYESVEKLMIILNNNKIDIVQLLNIHNTHTLSIIPEISKRNIPIVWRVIDYKILCPNRSFLNKGSICEACFNHKYYNPIIKKCKKQSLLASFVMSVESYFNYFNKFYDKIDFFSLQSNFSLSMFTKYGFDKNKLGVIENPYSFKQNHNNLKFVKDGSILFVGRISEEKGIMTLLKAMKNLSQIKLNLVGDGPQMQDVINYIKINNIKNVNILGKKWGDELEHLFSSASLLVVPSEWYEPNPYVVLQAYEKSVPVVASKTGGLPDMIVDGLTGLLFEMGNFKDLSKKIIKIHSNPVLQTKLGRGAQNFIKKYDPKLFYKYHIDLYKKLINKRQML